MYHRNFPAEYAIPEALIKAIDLARGVDISYGNDVAPSFLFRYPDGTTRGNNGLRLWAHPEKMADREYETARFAFVLEHDGETGDTVYTCETVADAIAFIESHIIDYSENVWLSDVRALIAPDFPARNEFRLEHASALLAGAFCKALAEALSAEDFKAVVSLNSTETDSGICHSGDFCDSNEIMLGAWVSIGLPEYGALPHPAKSYEFYNNLWNRAWSRAKRAGFDAVKAQRIRLDLIELRALSAGARLMINGQEHIKTSYSGAGVFVRLSDGSAQTCKQVADYSEKYNLPVWTI